MSDSSGIGSDRSKKTGTVQESQSSSIVSQDSVQRSWIRTWGRSPPEGLAREAVSRKFHSVLRLQVQSLVQAAYLVLTWLLVESVAGVTPDGFYQQPREQAQRRACRPTVEDRGYY
eukprot:COSAG02_NODE_575_length_20117_cov_5.801139_16_plen_116_part_00